MSGGRSLGRSDVTVYELDAEDSGYDDSARLARFLGSSRQRTSEEPRQLWGDDRVRREAKAFRDLLDARLGRMLS